MVYRKYGLLAGISLLISCILSVYSSDSLLQAVQAGSQIDGRAEVILYSQGITRVLRVESRAPGDEGLCPPLGPPTGTIVTVTTVNELQNAVNQAVSGQTIVIEDGVYALDGVYLRFDVSNVTLRSLSGDRDAVVLDGNYITTEIIQIVASGVTIADLTLREAYDHPIHVMSTDSGDTLETMIYNVHIIDPGEQAIKINPYTGENALFFPDNGVIACCHIELTDAGRSHIRNNCYTGGVDAHQARNWIVRDNLIEGFWCPEGLSEHGIHFWRSCRAPLVERNELHNNARGIGFGLATSGTGIRTYPDNPCPAASGGYVDHYGGIIRNNMVFASESELFSSEYGFDCGICLWNACDIQVLHNTVASTQAPFSSIEWRFEYTDVLLGNNLVSHNLRDRGGTDILTGNIEDAPSTLFVDFSVGDLHLREDAAPAIDTGAFLASGLCDDDFDGETRPSGSAADVGADEVSGECGTWDFDHDGDVDIADIRVVSVRWGCVSPQACYGILWDCNRDGRIDVMDAVTVCSCSGL